MLGSFRKRAAVITNFNKIVKDKEFAAKVVRNATTRELKLATFIAIQHGEEALKNFYKE